MNEFPLHVSQISCQQRYRNWLENAQVLNEKRAASEVVVIPFLRINIFFHLVMGDQTIAGTILALALTLLYVLTARDTFI